MKALDFMLAELRARDGLLPRDVAHGPGFAMLLDLLKMESLGKPVSVTSLCIASMAPSTTALRHIGELEQAGMIERQTDLFDRRVRYLVLTDSGRCAICSYLDAVGALL